MVPFSNAYIHELFKKSGFQHFFDLFNSNTHIVMYQNMHVKLDNYNITASCGYKFNRDLDLSSFLSQSFKNEIYNILNKKFINFLDDNVNTTERVSFFRNGNLNLINIFSINCRFSLKTKKLKNLDVLTLLTSVFHDLYSYYMDDDIFIVISPEMYNYMCHSCDQIELNNQENTPLFFKQILNTELRFGGCLKLKSSLKYKMNIFIQQNIKNNEVYVGTIQQNNNVMGTAAPKLMYNIDENCIFEISNPVSFERNFGLSVLFSFVGKMKVKKLILEI